MLHFCFDYNEFLYSIYYKTCDMFNKIKSKSTKPIKIHKLIKRKCTIIVCRNELIPRSLINNLTSFLGIILTQYVLILCQESLLNYSENFKKNILKCFTYTLKIVATRLLFESTRISFFNKKYIILKLNTSKRI